MISMLYFLSLFTFSLSQEWVWSVHPESGFKVLSPVTLTDHVKEVPTVLDIITYHQYQGGSLADSTLAMAFVIDHYVLPSSDQNSDPEYIRDFFENTIDQLLTSINGTLVYKDITSQAGQERCVWKGSFQDGMAVIKGQCILVGGKYYGLQVFGLKKNQPEILMNKFLDSFKLTGSTTP